MILLCLDIILFKRSYNPKKKGFGARPPEKLTEEEIDDLIQEWTPEPLLAALPSTNALTTRKEIYFLGWSDDGKVTISSDEPLPLGLNGILLEVEV